MPSERAEVLLKPMLRTQTENKIDVQPGACTRDLSFFQSQPLREWMAFQWAKLHFIWLIEKPTAMEGF
jgi:hypothetical protein